MAVLFVSLCPWRCEPPPEGRHGSVAAHWCARHPEVFSKVQEALRLRAPFPQVEEPAWTLADVVSAHSALKKLPKSGKLELCMTVRFAGQRTWTQAAQTAAYALFGDFLITNAESTGFCEHCAKPYLRGQKRLFCSHRCANARSKERSRNKATRISRRKAFRKASKALTKWLQGHHSVHSDWTKEVQNAAGLQTRDGRQNRTLGEFIRASRTEAGSCEREELLHSLRVADTVSESEKGSKEAEGLQNELDAFLRNVQAAEKIRQRSKRK